MSNSVLLGKLNKLERLFEGGGNCPLISYANNAKGSLFWRDVPSHIREHVKEHRIALATIRLKPGDWRPEAYESLSNEERDTIDKAIRIIDRKLEIKEGEEVKPVKIH